MLVSVILGKHCLGCFYLSYFLSYMDMLSKAKLSDIHFCSHRSKKLVSKAFLIVLSIFCIMLID